ncbi:MAG: hypothetical protein AAB396_02040 [Patescibacteria group bacterium]
MENYHHNEISLNNIEKEISVKIEKLKKNPIIRKAFDMLDDLPEYLRYHTKEHTEDVFHEAILFGIHDGLGEKELEKIAVAAAWHDIGFLIKQNNNETAAVSLFEREAFLLNLDYVNDIKKMIMDTKLEITENGPEILMKYNTSAYLLDADVSNFGRPDFKDKMNLIAEESKIDLNNKEIKIKFLKFTLTLLKNQNWHTNAARELRQEQKMINIAELEKEIELLNI